MTGYQDEFNSSEMLGQESQNNEETSVGSVMSEEIWPNYCNPSYRMPSTIDVRVSVNQGEYDFPVTIIKAVLSSKNYLGGFRNKINGSLYHHASTQTPIIKKETKDTSNLRTRETQTFEMHSLSVQSYRECGTQMDRIDLNINTKNDKELYSKTYLTAYDLDITKRIKTIEIQRFWRGYVARCLARRHRNMNTELSQKDKQQRIKAAQELVLNRELDKDRKSHPKTQADFAILYNELEAWRAGELSRIKAFPLSTEERTAAMTEMLDRETKTLQSIQRLKSAAQSDSNTERTQYMLEMMAEPHKWQLSSGSVAQVQTPATVRAKELLDLFNALSVPITSPTDIDSRLDVLLHVKWTVQEFDDPLTRDIADLVDREGDLLNRGRPLKSMEKLRGRLNNLVLQFLDDPHYNPRAADFLRK